MKTVYALVFMITLASALFALGGCAQTESSPEGAKDMSSNTSSNSSDSAPSKTQGSLAGVRVTAIDVGKGDCILVQTGDSSMLIDTGYESTAEKVVSYLRNQGVSRLDCLVITHYDKDHVGGIRTVGEAFDIDVVYLPGYQGADKNYRNAMAAVDELKLPAQQVVSEQEITLGGALLSILPSRVAFVPDAKGDEGNDDDLSLVTTLAFGDDSYLFAGDLEKDGIDAYLDRGLGHFDVLKMPDHGKKCGSTDEFLEDVQPNIVIVTDAVDDSADKKTLRLLNACGADVYRTSDCGTVVVESSGTGSYSVSTQSH